ncbi:MAG TPA: division/cell wall cluster transcriptional repressor MraZ [Acidimicrobiales bacterium]|nr:division/cell wall cluster transcriptional repressor MraZ [Acidimicrobiales bacterium]
MRTEVERMFLGEHSHSLDAKGRVILPARFRDQLAGAFVTSEVDGCLALWPPEEFEARSLEMRARMRGSRADRDVARAFFAGAQEASPDKQGRVALPAPLRDFAHLERDVAITGAFDHVEIWDATTWRERKRLGEQGLAGDETDGRGEEEVDSDAHAARER